MNEPSENKEKMSSDSNTPAVSPAPETLAPVSVAVKKKRRTRGKRPIDFAMPLLGSTSGVDHANIAPTPSKPVITLSFADVAALRQAVNGGPVLVNTDGTASIFPTADGTPVSNGQLSGTYQYFFSTGPGPSQMRQAPPSNDNVNCIPTGTSVNILGQLVRNVSAPATNLTQSSFVTQNQTNGGTEDHQAKPGNEKHPVLLNNLFFGSSGSNETQQRNLVIQHPVISSQSVRVPDSASGSHFYGFFTTMDQPLNASRNSNRAFVGASPTQQCLPKSPPGNFTLQASHQKSSGGKPPNLLRHIIAGQPIFETSTGEDFTPEERAYISGYFSVPINTRENLVGSNHESSVESSAASTKECEFCGVRKPVAHFPASGRFCTKTCARRHNVSCRNRNKPPHSSVISPTSPSASTSPGMTDISNPKITDPASLPKRGRPRSAKPIAQEQAKNALDASFSADEPSIPLPVGQSTENIEKEKICTSARFRLLLRQKPEIRNWTTNDVKTFLQTINGFEAYLSKFGEECIDGEALSLILNEEGIDAMVKDWKIPRGLVRKLDHIVRLINVVPFHEDSVSCLIGK